MQVLAGPCKCHAVDEKAACHVFCATSYCLRKFADVLTRLSPYVGASATTAESSYDGEEEGQGEFDSFVEPAGLVLSSFIEQHIIKNPMYCGGEAHGRPCCCFQHQLAASAQHPVSVLTT